MLAPPPRLTVDPDADSISPSGRSNIGFPVAGGVHEDSATPNDRARSLTRRATAATASTSSPRPAAAPAIFSTSTVAPTPRRPAVYSRILHGNVVVDEHRFDRDSLVRRVLGGELEVHHVTGVVLHDVHHSGTAVDGLCRREHLIRDGRGGHLSRTCRIEHPAADESAVERFMARAASGDQGDLARDGRIGPHDYPCRSVVAQQVAVSGGQAAQRPWTRSAGSLRNFFIVGVMATAMMPPFSGPAQRRRGRDA